MTPQQFRDWRTAMGLTQQQAADALGMSKSTVENYESGRRRDNDQAVEIPKVVALACAAIASKVNDDTSIDDHLAQWHNAAAKRYATLLAQLPDGNFTMRNYHQFSYAVAHPWTEEVDDLKLVHELQLMNEEVHDRVRTGWTMFYPFTRDDIKPRFVVDKDSGSDEHDFLECSLVSTSMTGANDYWRVSRDGSATLLRGYHEDRPDVASYYRTERGSFLSPNWLVRDIAELVRHAQAFSERFPNATAVAFRCAWYGLANRSIYDPNALWRGYTFGESDERVSTGWWSVKEITEKWPMIISKLVAPLARAADIGHIITPEWVQNQAPRWRT